MTAAPDPTLPTPEDLRQVVDDLLSRFAALPDDGWDRPAAESEWTCREAAAHLVDSLGFYAMQLSGSGPFRTSYVQLADRTDSRRGSPPVVFWPDPEVCRRVLNRLFPTAARTDDPWHDLLAATGRTPETRGSRWRWDSSVRARASAPMA